MITLRQVECCATCNHSEGWMDDMRCGFHKIETRPYWICNDYDKNEYMREVRFMPLISYVKDMGKR